MTQYRLLINQKLKRPTWSLSEDCDSEVKKFVGFQGTLMTYHSADNMGLFSMAQSRILFRRDVSSIVALGGNACGITTYLCCEVNAGYLYRVIVGLISGSDRMRIVRPGSYYAMNM